ncbi:glyoxal oxidase [Mycena filopes]|nr:glyoxal oxidase [Mycena filopes]
MSRASLVLLLLGLPSVLAQDASSTVQQPTATTLNPPSQPSSTGAPGEFELIGKTLVSAQQMFLGTLDKVFILDKVENNAEQIGGHPAWASASAPWTAITNTFCAGGNVLGNGTWINIGGNAAIGYGGALVDGTGPYDDPDGGKSIRTLVPCDDGQCDWVDGEEMTTRRWYPTVSADATTEATSTRKIKDNPTYEFYPSTGSPITSPFLSDNLPVNLYPITYLLPSGKLLMQANRATILLDPKSHKESALDDMPDAVRVYPASAGNIMLPLTPANNWTATVLFCGGSDNDDWSTDWDIASLPASASCVKITPDRARNYVKEDALPEGRSMGSLVALPDGRVLCLNGAKMGTAGYGNESWAVGMSYADSPVLTPAIYDPLAANGTRWSRAGLSPSTVPRMYHSTALLLPDGAVLVAGSNPNTDLNVGPKVKYPTEYRIEKFYPEWYNERRPEPVGLLSQLGYGGEAFDVLLGAEDLGGDARNAGNASVVIIRPGFSTHGMSMGQRFVQLDSTYTAYGANNTATLHVSQLPPNPAILAPGPALLFVVVNGVPSVGVQVMVGSGVVGPQPVRAIGDLVASSYVEASGGEGEGQSKSGNGASGLGSGSGLLWTLGLGLLARTLLGSIC